MDAWQDGEVVFIRKGQVGRRGSLKQRPVGKHSKDGANGREVPSWTMQRRKNMPHPDRRAELGGLQIWAFTNDLEDLGLVEQKERGGSRMSRTNGFSPGSRTPDFGCEVRAR